MQYDGDFKIGDTVEIIISKYNMEKKLVYGKIPVSYTHLDVYKRQALS